MAVVDELVTKFSFIGSLAPQKEFNLGTALSIKGIAKLTAGLAAASTAFQAWAGNVLAGLDPMIDLSKSLGINIEAMQELGYAASVSGSSADTMNASLRGLAQRAGEASMGMGRAKVVFAKLGIGLRDSNGQVKDATALWEDLRVATSGMGLSEKMGVLNRLGVNPELVQLLGKTNGEMKELRDTARSLGVITAQQADAADAYNDAWTTVRYALKALANELALSVAPEMKAMADAFVGFIRDSSGPIRITLQRIGAWLVGIGKFARENAKAITIFGAALALAVSPVTRILAVLSGLWLVVDDLIVAFQGGRSAIRYWIKEWTGFDITPMLQGAWAAVKQFVQDVKDNFAPLGVLLKGTFGDLADAVKKGDWAGAWEIIKEGASVLWEWMKGEIAALGSWTADFLGEGIMGGIRSALGVGSDLWRGDFAAAWAKVKPMVLKVRDWLLEALKPVLDWLERNLVMLWKRNKDRFSLGSLLLGIDVGGENKGGQLYADRLSYALGSGTSVPTGGLNATTTINIMNPDPVAAGRAVQQVLPDALTRAADNYRRRLR